MPVYPRLNFPIKNPPSGGSTANSDLESEAQSVPRLRARRSLRQDLRSTSAAEHTDLDGINNMLDHMATSKKPTRDPSSQQAEDARIASAWENRSGAKVPDFRPRVSLPSAAPSSLGQAATSGQHHQQQANIFSDPQMMASFDTAAIAQSNQELERMKQDLAIAKAEQAKAEQEQYHVATPSNGATEKQPTPVSNEKAGRQTSTPLDGAGQKVQTPNSKDIKQKQHTPTLNGAKHEQHKTPASNGKTPISNGKTPVPNGNTPVTNGKTIPSTPLSIDTSKHVANTAAIVEASAKVKQLTKDLEATGWEMQTLKQDLDGTRSELVGLKREMSVMKLEAGGAKREVTAANAEVAKLKGEIDGMKGLVEMMVTYAGTLARNLESASGEMKGLGKHSLGVKQDLEGLKEQITKISSSLINLTDITCQTENTLVDLASQTKTTLGELASQIKTILAEAAAAAAKPATTNPIDTTVPNTTSSPSTTTTTTTPIKPRLPDPFNSRTPQAPGTFPTTPSSTSQTQTQTRTNANVAADRRPAPARGPDFWDSTIWSYMHPALQIVLFGVTLHLFLQWTGYEAGMLDRAVYQDLVDLVKRIF